MSLGTNISRLRADQKLSQGELAEALGVSRQSVSKWETDGAVPELDKLIKLSRLFGVTLDALVTGEVLPPQEPPPQEPARAGRSPRKIAGIVLLCMAVLTWLLFTLLGSFLAGAICAAPFLLCGVICLALRRHVGLYCAWAVFFSVDAYLRYATGINWRIILLTPTFEPWMNYVRLAVGWCQFLGMIALVAATVLICRGAGTAPTGRRRVLLLCGWALFAVLHIPVPLELAGRWPSFVLAVLDGARLILLAALLTICARWLRQRGRRQRFTAGPPC